MKMVLIILSCIGLLLYFVGTADMAHAVLFDFDGLSAWDGSSVIESYMEGIYGSDIEIIGAVVPPLLTRGHLGPDACIVNNRNEQFWDILIKFMEVPITSVSFDWEVFAESGTPDAVFSVYYAEGERIEYWTYSGDQGFGTITPPFKFSRPVYAIAFSDNSIHDIGIDSLMVTPVPGPNSLLLLSSGLVGLAGLRKRPFVRK